MANPELDLGYLASLHGTMDGSEGDEGLGAEAMDTGAEPPAEGAEPTPPAVEPTPVDLTPDSLVRVVVDGEERVMPWKEAHGNISGKLHLSQEQARINELEQGLRQREETVRQRLQGMGYGLDATGEPYRLPGHEEPERTGMPPAQPGAQPADPVADFIKPYIEAETKPLQEEIQSLREGSLAQDRTASEDHANTEMVESVGHLIDAGLKQVLADPGIDEERAELIKAEAARMLHTTLGEAVQFERDEHGIVRNARWTVKPEAVITDTFGRLQRLVGKTEELMAKGEETYLGKLAEEKSKPALPKEKGQPAASPGAEDIGPTTPEEMKAAARKLLAEGP